MTLQNKYNLLQQILKNLERVVVAYSGGVDSTFLLKVAVDTLGSENVLACIGISSSLAKSQYNRAIECAKIIGAHVEEVEVHEVLDTNYSANSPDRCFHCKSHLYTVLQNIAKRKGFENVVCGCNFDDMDDFRPGNNDKRRHPHCEQKSQFTYGRCTCLTMPCFQSHLRFRSYRETAKAS
ncbi:MAG: ATP-dependent sacrificial sulfur transferase LarE [Planctomycetota bacterium]